MARAVLIMQADPLPIFFSATVARNLGATAGWSEDKEKALAFARVSDAKTFAEIYLPMVAPHLNYMPVELADA